MWSKRLAATKPAVISIMHTSANDTDDAIDVVRKHWDGPLGTYPESGYFKSPDWQFLSTSFRPKIWLQQSRDVAEHKGATHLWRLLRHRARSHCSPCKGVQLMKTGSCLCGGVAFEMRGPLEPVTACHCIQCRKQTGNYWASTIKRRCGPAFRPQGYTGLVPGLGHGAARILQGLRLHPVLESGWPRHHFNLCRVH